ncbi:MAG: bifunctional methylenetetrahydrofolate dehydrogenase/methenyltetrahydrofolate cyclohydrolase FolD [Alphaproteobacteria bacterium]|jgi:methylenetetrahydrofolate dehydrogenase (NADP+)/methenyltetrahydrofolate cyclohydrolase
MSKIIDGKALAKSLRQDIKSAVNEIKSEYNYTPALAVVLVGENPASKVYVNSKAKQTVECGMESFEFKLPAETSEQDVLAKVEELNNDPKVHGILVQLPLPKHINEEKIINAIAVEKDVDGFQIINSGQLATGTGSPLIACTPYGCLMMLQDKYGKDLSGLNAVVIGRSNIVGKPMAQLLLDANATVTIVHSRTKNIEEMTKQADIVVAAVGRPEMVKASWIKQGATIIDVGINRIEVDGKGKLVGDVDFADVEPVAGAITPVPGGVGPMTIAVLLHNSIVASCRQNNKPVPKILDRYNRF